MTDSIYYERPKPQLYIARCLEPSCTWGTEGDLKEVEAAIRTHEHKLIALNWIIKRGKK